STEIISKSVCLEDSVPLIQNVSLINRTLVINQTYGASVRQIAKWFIQNSTISSVVDNRYERLLFLDEHGTIWMRNVTDSDEGRYVLVYTEDTGNVYGLDVELIVLEAPSKRCKASIKLEDTYLVAFFDHNDCGRPLASVYWLGYTNDTMIHVLPGVEASTYHACIESPSLICMKGSKASDFCSSFRKKTNEVLGPKIPKINLFESHILDISIVLQCQSRDEQARSIYWKRNGIQINNNEKYNQMNNFLSIRYLKIGEQYDIYTCVESEGRFESDPYSIDTYGPTAIEFKQNIVMIKEQDKLNISCITVCYPLCSVKWSKLDPSSDQKQRSLLNEKTLQLAHITREMSGNYSCKVQNLISGAFNESTLSLHVNYGPDEIVVNTSSNIIEVNTLDSITILCIAECFPPCRFSWMEISSRQQTQDAELKLINVTSNGTYTCRVHNPKTDSAKNSEKIKIAVKLDGPHEVVIHTSDNTTELYEFSSITLVCSSDCFPPCIFRWTFLYTDTVKEGAELNLLNVSSNDAITCHVTNPINMNVTFSRTITVMGKPDNKSLRWYLIHVFPGIGGCVLIVGVLLCVSKKCLQSLRASGVSSNTMRARLITVKHLQVETQSQHYWTIVTNARGELRSSRERDLNLEDRGFECTDYSVPTETDTIVTQNHYNSEELEAHLNPLEIETSRAGYVEREEYINPIYSENETSKEYFEPSCLHSVEFSEYIHPIPSDHDEIDVGADPTHCD
ncbi:hypothetical protein ACJMK2_025714, partial [Sinanodonta woodiana]